MKQWICAWLKNWPLFIISAAVGLSLPFTVHVFLNQREAEVEIVSSSHHEEDAAGLPWEGEPKAATDFKAKRDVKDLALWLKSFDFMVAFLKTNCSGLKPKGFCVDIKADKEIAPLVLLKAIDGRVEDDKVLHLKARASNNENAAQLANAMAAALLKLNKDQAAADLNIMERRLIARRRVLQLRLRKAVGQLSQGGSGASPTLMDDEKQFSFLSDLQIKIAEIDVNLANNQHAIEILQEQTTGSVNGDYGPALKISRIRNESRLLQGTKASLEQQRNVTRPLDSAEEPQESLTQIQAQFRVDLESFKSVAKAIERIRLIALVQELNIEVIQQAAPIMVKDRWPFALLLALGLFLSQCFAGVGFSLLKLWQEETDMAVYSAGKNFRLPTAGKQLDL